MTRVSFDVRTLESFIRHTQKTRAARAHFQAQKRHVKYVGEGATCRIFGTNRYVIKIALAPTEIGENIKSMQAEGTEALTDENARELEAVLSPVTVLVNYRYTQQRAGSLAVSFEVAACLLYRIEGEDRLRVAPMAVIQTRFKECETTLALFTVFARFNLIEQAKEFIDKYFAHLYALAEKGIFDMDLRIFQCGYNLRKKEASSGQDLYPISFDFGCLLRDLSDPLAALFLDDVEVFVGTTTDDYKRELAETGQFDHLGHFIEETAEYLAAGFRKFLNRKELARIWGTKPEPVPSPFA